MKVSLPKIQVLLIAIFGYIGINTVYGQYKDDVFYYSIRSYENHTVAVSGLIDENKTDITFPSNVKLFGEDFSVTSVAVNAFNGCTNLKSVTMPSSITQIGGGAFAGCTNLETFNIPSSVVEIDNNVFEDTRWFKKKPDGELYINKVFYVYKQKKEGSSIDNQKPKPDLSVKIKEGTVSISPAAFDCVFQLVHIEIPDGIKKIAYSTFNGCSRLDNVTIPSSVVEIEQYAFMHCSSLKTVNVPSSVEVVEGNAFLYTPWYENKPDGVVYIGSALYDFKGDPTAFTSIIVREGTKSISGQAFEDCTNLKEVTLPKGLGSISGRAFAGCTSLATINFPEGIKAIKDEVFLNCSALAIDLVLPETLMSLGRNVFQNCKSITSIYFPKNLKNMSYGTFLNCTGVKEINIGAVTPPEIYENTFEGVDATINIYVPVGSLDAYKKNYYWKTTFTNFIEKDFSGVKEISADDIDVRAVNGSIVIDGNGRADVYNLSGQCIYSGHDRLINLERGLYIVRVGGKTVKIGL